MATDYDAANTLCPFYISEDCRKVSCEGIYTSSTLRLHFLSGEDKRKHKELYCNADYLSCPISKMLFSKYEKKNNKNNE